MSRSQLELFPPTVESSLDEYIVSVPIRVSVFHQLKAASRGRILHSLTAPGAGSYTWKVQSLSIATVDR
jgi:hypothetical protein